MFGKRKFEHTVKARLKFIEDSLIEAEIEMDLCLVMHLDHHAESFRKLAHRCYEAAIEISATSGVTLPRYIDLLQRELEASS